MSLIAEFKRTKQSFGAVMNTIMTRAANKKLAERLVDKELNEEEVAAIDINVNTATTDFDNIKSALVEQGQEVPTGTPTAQYGALINEVAEIQKAAGAEQGKQAQYDEFWDSYQNYGKRAFARLFNSKGWNDTTFKPKYSMKYFDSANEMFAESQITDLQAILDRQGVTFDFSSCYSFANLLQDSTITHIGEVSTVSASAVTNIFYLARNLKTVDLLILKSDGSQTFSNSFQSCNALENIVIEGTIGTNFDIRWSPLTHDSLMSIINALKDYSTNTSGTTYTLRIGETNIEKLTAEEQEAVATKGWALL